MTGLAVIAAGAALLVVAVAALVARRPHRRSAGKHRAMW